MNVHLSRPGPVKRCRRRVATTGSVGDGALGPSRSGHEPTRPSRLRLEDEDLQQRAHCGSCAGGGGMRYVENIGIRPSYHLLGEQVGWPRSTVHRADVGPSQ